MKTESYDHIYALNPSLWLLSPGGLAVSDPLRLAYRSRVP